MPESLHMVPPNNFFIVNLIETFHISRKWAFFGLLSHPFFPLPIHISRENFDFKRTNIIKHWFVLKSKKEKEFTFLWAQHFTLKHSSPWRYYFNIEGETLMGEPLRSNSPQREIQIVPLSKILFLSSFLKIR